MSLVLADIKVESEAAVQVEPLEWEVRLGDSQPQKRLVVLAVALLVGMLGIIILKQVVIGIIGSLAILFSTSEVFLPIRYRLDKTGASAKVGLSRTEILWPAVRRVDEGEMAVKISPMAESTSRLEPFRGVNLRFAGNRDEVLAKIRQFRGDL